jgi:hypothetical protein
MASIPTDENRKRALKDDRVSVIEHSSTCTRRRPTFHYATSVTTLALTFTTTLTLSGSEGTLGRNSDSTFPAKTREKASVFQGGVLCNQVIRLASTLAKDAEGKEIWQNVSRRRSLPALKAPRSDRGTRERWIHVDRSIALFSTERFDSNPQSYDRFMSVIRTCTD